MQICKNSKYPEYLSQQNFLDLFKKKIYRIYNFLGVDKAKKII